MAAAERTTAEPRQRRSGGQRMNVRADRRATPSARRSADRVLAAGSASQAWSLHRSLTLPCSALSRSAKASGSPSTWGSPRISVFGLLIVLLVGTSLVAKEIERRTIYNLLSRPIARPALPDRQVARTHRRRCGSVAAVAGRAPCACVLAVARSTARARAAVLEAAYLAGLELTVVTALAVMFSRALDAGALGALHARGSTCVGPVELATSREFARQSPRPLGVPAERDRRTWCRTCRSSTCARWRRTGELTTPVSTSAFATAVRARLLRLRAGARPPRPSSRGTSSERGAALRAPWRRMGAGAGLLALALGAGAWTLAGARSRQLSAPAPARGALVLSRRAAARARDARPRRNRGRPRVAARGPVLRRAPPQRHASSRLYHVFDDPHLALAALRSSLHLRRLRRWRRRTRLRSRGER